MAPSIRVVRVGLEDGNENGESCSSSCVFVKRGFGFAHKSLTGRDASVKLRAMINMAGDEDEGEGEGWRKQQSRSKDLANRCRVDSRSSSDSLHLLL
jgi:hypothetical protein